MKRLISAAIALTLLGTAAASAQSYRHGGGYGHGGGYSRGWHGRGGNDGALIGLGIGLFALGAIAASSRDRYDDRYEYGPPPPPPPAYYGSRYDYDRGYGY
jgi:hypothetical protein